MRREKSERSGNLSWNSNDYENSSNRNSKTVAILGRQFGKGCPVPKPKTREDNVNRSSNRRGQKVPEEEKGWRRGAG